MGLFIFIVEMMRDWNVYLIVKTYLWGIPIIFIIHKPVKFDTKIVLNATAYQ